MHIFYPGEGYLPDLAVFLQIVDEIVVNQFGQWFVDGVQKHGYRKAIVVQCFRAESSGTFRHEKFFKVYISVRLTDDDIGLFFGN